MFKCRKVNLARCDDTPPLTYEQQMSALDQNCPGDPDPAGPYNVIFQPHKRPGRAIGFLASSSKKRRLIAELKTHEYVETFSDDMLSSLEEVKQRSHVGSQPSGLQTPLSRPSGISGQSPSIKSSRGSMGSAMSITSTGSCSSDITVRSCTSSMQTQAMSSQEHLLQPQGISEPTSSIGYEQDIEYLGHSPATAYGRRAMGPLHDLILEVPKRRGCQNS